MYLRAKMTLKIFPLFIYQHNDEFLSANPFCTAHCHKCTGIFGKKERITKFVRDNDVESATRVW